MAEKTRRCDHGKKTLLTRAGAIAALLQRASPAVAQRMIDLSSRDESRLPATAPTANSPCFGGAGALEADEGG